jgi:hypothetical protein
VQGLTLTDEAQKSCYGPKQTKNNKGSKYKAKQVRKLIIYK